MSDTSSLTRTGITLAVLALLTAVGIAATSFFLTSRLSDEDALLADMNTILTTVSDQAVANTESFLRPADQTASFLTSFIKDGVLDPKAPGAERLLLDVLQSNPSFDAIFVGSADGSFLYVNRFVDDHQTAYGHKQIRVQGADRQVELATYDRTLVESSASRDDGDTYDPRTRVWYTAAATAGQGAWTDPYIFFSSGLPGVTRAEPVVVGTTVEHVVGVDIRIEALSDFMAERSPSPNGAAFIMTTTHQMVAYPDLAAIEDGNQLRFAHEVDDPALRWAGNSIGRHFMSGTRSVSETPEINGERTQFIYTTLQSNDDWVVTAWSPNSDFLSGTQDTASTNRSIALGLGVLILVELLAAVIWMFRRLSENHRLLAESEAASQLSTTERDKAQHELARTNAALESSNRELEQYAYAAAHDLRTPLRAIGGYSELIDREAAKDDVDVGRIQSWAQQIVVGYDRMGRTMDNLLEHARLSRLGLDGTEMELVDTETILRAVLSDLEAELAAVGGQVTIEKLPSVLADPTQLSRVFQNLLENALRFREPTRPLQVTVEGVVEDDQTRFRVSDNGVGISGADKARIFESFSRANESSGVGLGLSLVKRIIEDHGGEIQAEAEVASGSVFEFTLRNTHELSTQ